MSLKPPYLLLIPLAVYFMFAFARIPVWPLLHDEAVTFDQAVGPVYFGTKAYNPKSMETINGILDASSNYSLSDVTTALEKRGMHPPAYYIFIHYWTKWFGTGPYALRLPGIGFGIVSIIGIWFLAKRITSWKWAGLLSASFLSVSIVFLKYTLYLRPYGMFLAISIWSCLIVLDLGGLGRSGKPKLKWILFSCLSILGIYTIYHYFFILLWQFALLSCLLFFSSISFSRGFRALILNGVCIGLAYLPWAGIFFHHLKLTGGDYYFKHFYPFTTWSDHVPNLLYAFIFHYREETPYFIYSIVKILVLLTAICFATLCIRVLKQCNRKLELCFWFSTSIMPLAMILSDYWHGTHTLFIVRTSLFFLPLLILWIVFSVSHLPRNWARYFILLPWFAIFLYPSLGNAFYGARDMNRKEILTNYVSSHDQPSHVVVFNHRERGYLVPILKYFKDRGIRNIRIQLAQKPGAGDVVNEMGKDKSVEFVTLVNLDIKYLKNFIWTEKEIESFSRILETAGKKVKSYHVRSQYL